MKLRIITAQKINEYFVSWIDIHTPAGNAVILEHHAPMVAMLVPGRKLSFKLKTGETEHVSVTKSGIIEIQRDQVTVLI